MNEMEMHDEKDTKNKRRRKDNAGFIRKIPELVLYK